MISITSQNFEAEVVQSQTPVVILWGGHGTINANIMAIGLKQFAKFAPKPPKLGRIDLNHSADLAMQFSIRNEPFLMLFVDGAAIVSGDSLNDFLRDIAPWTN